MTLFALRDPFLLFAFLFFSLRFIFVNDMSFLGDEAMLLNNALDANEMGVWVKIGLEGSKGDVYGPLVTWIYQFLLKFSQNLNILILIKIAFESALQFWGVSELRRIFPRWPNFMFFLIFMSPYLFFYSRMFWDNPFNISSSLLLFTGSVSFFRSPSFLKLIRVALLAAICVSIHLMSGSLVLALAIWILTYHWRYLVKNFYQSFAALSLAVLILLPYLIAYLSRDVNGSSTGNTWIWNFKFLEGALLGTRLLTGLGLNYFYGYGFSFLEFSLVYFLGFLGGLQLLAFFWAFFSLLMTPWRADIRSRIDASMEGLPLTRFLLIFFGIHFAVCFLKQVSNHPHYFNASWVPFWILTSYGLVSFMKSQRMILQKLTRIYIPLYQSVAFIALLSLLYLVHTNEGARSIHYGPTRNHLEKIVDNIIIKNIDPKNLTYDPSGLKGYSHSIELLHRLATKERPIVMDRESVQGGIISWSDPESEKNPRLKLLDPL